jgi:hypothetical protein
MMVHLMYSQVDKAWMIVNFAGLVISARASKSLYLAKQGTIVKRARQATQALQPQAIMLLWALIVSTNAREVHIILKKRKQVAHLVKQVSFVEMDFFLQMIALKDTIAPPTIV